MVGYRAMDQTKLDKAVTQLGLIAKALTSVERSVREARRAVEALQQFLANNDPELPFDQEGGT